MKNKIVMLEKFKKQKVKNLHIIKGGETNGVYAQASLGYKSAAYLNISARNDWTTNEG